MNAEPEPRRLTPTERSHQALLAAITRPVRADAPSFKVAQVKGVGGAVVIEWDVSIPVCEEYPTAAEAFAASLDFGRQYRSLFVGDVPAPEANGGTAE